MPGTAILRNKLAIMDQRKLDRAERLFVVQRTIEGPPAGSFDLIHLKSIHRHLFQDIYDWAGEIRTVEIAKESRPFQFIRFIETGMADVQRRLSNQSFLKHLSEKDFCEQAAKIIGDVNYVHPFREGNGRTQLEYLRQLAETVGHNFDPDRLDPDTWQYASKLAYDGDYQSMATAILEQGIRGSQNQLKNEQLYRTAAWKALQNSRGL